MQCLVRYICRIKVFVGSLKRWYAYTHWLISKEFWCWKYRSLFTCMKVWVRFQNASSPNFCCSHMVLLLFPSARHIELLEFSVLDLFFVVYMWRSRMNCLSDGKGECSGGYSTMLACWILDVVFVRLCYLLISRKSSVHKDNTSWDGVADFACNNCKQNSPFKPKVC